MKIIYISIICLITNIATAEWIEIGDYDFNTESKEFWNRKLSVGGTLNTDQTIASLQANDTVNLIDKLNSFLEILPDENYDLFKQRRTTRAELFDEVCQFFKTGTESWQCDNIRRISLATFGMIVANLQKGEQVKIEGFGSFGLSIYPAREGRNPKTGEPVQIPATRRVLFRPYQSLKDAIDSPGNGTEETGCWGGCGNGETDSYLLEKVGNQQLVEGEGKTGFTATTNTKPPPSIVKVTTTVNQNEGIISPSIEGYIGSKFSIGVVPKEGYKFVGWSNAQCETGIFNTPITCTPIFVRMYKLTFNIIGNGIIRDADYNQITTLYAEAGKTISLSPLAGAGYKNAYPLFSPSPCNFSFTMPSQDLTCTATFLKI